MNIRRSTVAALAALSLSGGAVAGALLFSPAVSGAQTDTTEEPADDTNPETGESEGCHHGHGPGHHLETAAEVLGMTTEDLRAALEDGQTLADVAEAQAVDVDDLIGALVAEQVERLDAAVADGRFTEEQAAEMKESLTERVTARVNGERPDRPADAGVGRMRGRFGPPPWASGDGPGIDGDAADLDVTAA